MPLLDTLVMQELERTLSTTIYRKLTHAVEYLHLGSHHSHAAKYNVLNTITQGRTVCSNPLLLQIEEKELKALDMCNHPTLALNRLKTKTNTKYNTKSNNKSNTNKTDDICMEVPYTKGPSECFKKICNKHGILLGSMELIPSITS